MLGVPLALAARVLLHAFGAQAVLGRRVEVATPLNSLFRCSLLPRAVRVSSPLEISAQAR